MNKLIVQGRKVSEVALRRFAETLSTDYIKKNNSYVIHTEDFVTQQRLRRISNSLQMDVNLIPSSLHNEQVGLLVTDMDSTLISIECIDEIADFAGLKAQVSAVTEAAMRGELDFAESLTQRVSFLKGLDQSVLNQVYEERLQLNPGAESLVSGLRQHGIKTALVSGGFTFFTDRLKDRLGLDYTLANTLEIINGKLTGKVLGDIVGGEAKAAFLLDKKQSLAPTRNQVIAMGDGANDLLMMNAADLGIAYRAKPAVQAQADCTINHSDLDGVLALLEL